MTKIIFSLAVVLSTLACNKTNCGPDPVTAVEQIVFGVHHAECMGDCSQNFQLTTTRIFADTCDFCLITDIGFQTTPLPDEKFQIAKSLFESVPAELLLNTAETVFGCPGCHDEGGYRLEITKNGASHLYRWSENFTDVPDELRPYFEKVIQTLRDL